MQVSCQMFMQCCKCNAEPDEDGNWEDFGTTSRCCEMPYCWQCLWRSKLEECPNSECRAIDNTCSRFNICNNHINTGINSSYLVRCTLCYETQVLCDECSRGVHGQRHCEKPSHTVRNRSEYGHFEHID